MLSGSGSHPAAILASSFSALARLSPYRIQLASGATIQTELRWLVVTSFLSLMTSSKAWPGLAPF